MRNISYTDSICAKFSKAKFVRAASTTSFLAALTASSLALTVLRAYADAPPGPYFNGFETDTAGWFNYSGATINRVPSGDMSSTYASGVAAATGNYYARLSKDPTPDSCTFGG